MSREAPGHEGPRVVDETVVTTIASGPEGELWLGTLAGVYRTRRGSLQPEIPEGLNAEALGKQPVTALALDRSGSMWIGTTGGGLFRLPRPPAPFRTLGAKGEGLSSLAFEDVTAVLEDREGRLWVGTFGGGVDRLDVGAPRFVNVSSLASSFGNSNGILHLAEDREGRIWAGSTAGLHRYDPREGRTLTFAHDVADPSSIGRGYVAAMLVDRDGRVWAGTGGGGLHRLRPDERGFDHFPMRPRDPTSPGDDYVTVLHEDRQGRLWEGTRSGGLNLIDRATGSSTTP
jgi:ligand-binding sensor domain-containing protein